MTTTTLAIILYTSLSAFLIFCFLNLRTLLFSSNHRHPSAPLPPGPRPWPIIGNLPHLGTMPHHSLAALARTYGPLVHLRLGFVDVVVAASADVAEQFLKTHDSNFSNRPPNSGAKHIAYNYQDLVFAPYGARWRMLRKICAVHLFSAKALDDFRHVREQEVGILVQALAGGGRAVAVNLGQLLGVCTTNALARVMLGRRVFSDGVDPKADEFKEMVVELMALAGEFNIGDFIPALEWLDLQGVASKMKKLHARFDSFLDQFLKEHNKINGGDGGRRADLLTTLISLKDINIVDDEVGGKLTDTEIKALLLNKRCQICGDTGVTEAIASCLLCKDAHEHVYCMGKGKKCNVFPLDWRCEACESPGLLSSDSGVKKDFTKGSVSNPFGMELRDSKEAAGQNKLIRGARGNWREKEVQTGKTKYLFTQEVIKMPSGDKKGESNLRCSPLSVPHTPFKSTSTLEAKSISPTNSSYKVQKNPPFCPSISPVQSGRARPGNAQYEVVQKVNDTLLENNAIHSPAKEHNQMGQTVVALTSVEDMKQQI